jgi:hypothetical protein
MVEGVSKFTPKNEAIAQGKEYTMKPTLIEDLEDVATKIATLIPDHAARLRAAATRFREEVAKSARQQENAALGGDARAEAIEWAKLYILARINGGSQ